MARNAPAPESSDPLEDTHDDRVGIKSTRDDPPLESAPRKKRVMSEKQLENLRKGREARASKLKGKKTPEVETSEVETPEVETSEVETPEVETPEVETPEVVTKPKKKLTQKQLDALKKARESKAAKVVPKKRPPTMVTRKVETTVFDNLRIF